MPPQRISEPRQQGDPCFEGIARCFYDGLIAGSGLCEFVRNQELPEKKRFVGIQVLSRMDDYEVEERKQAAADALMHYSQFAMTCIGQGVQPSKLRLHLLKELSGMPTTLKKEYPQQGSPSTASNATTIDKADHASSSATTVAEPEVDRAANLL